VISFYFTFVRALITHIFLENEERENTYKRQGQIYGENEEDCAKQILCSLIFLRERKCFEQLRRFVYE